MERMDVDFFGNVINIGDEVVFEAPKYRMFAVGKVVTKAEKSCQIEYVNNWNFPSKGKVSICRQAYDQIIKNTSKAELKNNWISVEDRLPENFTDVLCWYEYFRYGEYNCMYQTYGIGHYNSICEGWGGEVSNGYKARVLAWMPLPTPPVD